MTNLHGGDRASFVDLMALEAVKSSAKNHEDGVYKFMSKHPAFNPGGGSAYGGHVYSQSVWAAAQTVSDGMVVHNAHGYFTLPVWTERPLFYTVRTLSSGRSYCTRFVTVRQPVAPSSSSFRLQDGVKGLGKVCFASMCSFKRDEAGSPKYQAQADLEQRYASVLKKDPSEHAAAPRIDSPWYHRLAAQLPQAVNNDFPGLDIRRVDMTAFNTPDKLPQGWRHLSYYRPIGTIPPSSHNLHACAHLYASDRNSLFLISNAAGFGDEVSFMGSLSHSVVFHVSGKELVMNEKDWWCQEAEAPRGEGGRGLHQSRIWSRHGVHIATTMQDGVVRKADKDESQKQRKSWLEGMLARNDLDDRVMKKLKEKL